MRKIKLFTTLCLVALLSLSFIKAKAYDSIDSTGKAEWYITSEEEQYQNGVYYSHMIGKSKIEGATGTEKNVNYFSMKTDGVNSKLVTWIKQQNNSIMANTKLSDLAKDYEKNHPGWIVVAGVNADQWFYGTTYTATKGGYFYYKNQTYYPLTVDGQNYYTISPTGNSGNGVAITNDSTNPIASVSGSVAIELQIYDEFDNLINTFNVSGYNKTPGENDTTVWSGYYSEKSLGEYVDRTVNAENDLYIIEDSKLAYMNNTRDYPIDLNGTYYPTDSFYGNGVISKIAKEITLSKGQFAIETTNEEVKELLKENVKVIVEQQYGTQIANQVESVTGYHTVQVKDGEYKDSKAAYNTQTRPRSMFGVKEDGTYFLLTTRDVSNTSTGGTVHLENQAILNYYGAYTAYQHDGGGSVTAIYRNTTGGFDVVSESCDSGTKERAVASGLFFVVRDPGFESYKKNSTSTSVTFTKKTGVFFEQLENISVTVDGQTVTLEENLTTVTINNLEPNKEYIATIKYTYNGVEYTSETKCQTKAYDPGINIIPNSYGFTIKKYSTDPILKTIKVDFTVDNSNTYTMGDVNEFEITELFKGEVYTISYVCTVENQNTKETYQIEGPTKQYKTLSYEVPKVTKLEEGRKTDDSLRVSYAYTDNDGLVTKAYIYLNNTKYELTKKSGTHTFDNLDFTKNTYKIKIVLYYLVDDFEEELESEILTYEKPACVHEYDNDCDTTCNKCNETRETGEHKWVEATCTTPKHCSICNLEEGTPVPHTEVIDEGYDATCAETGLTEGSHCSVCNEVIVAQEIIEKLAHTEVIDEGYDATCTESGLTEGSHCLVCNEVIVAQVVIDALGHTEVVDAAIDATCTESGLTEGSHCSVCNEVLKAQEEIKALGHTEVVDEGYDATCTESGLTEGSHCSVCNEVLKAQEEIKALGHTEVVDAAIDATCTDAGLTEGKHCSVCNEVLKAQEEIKALGHTEVVDKGYASTCEKEGLTDGSHCSVCNEVLKTQETIKKAEHTWVDATKKAPKTCSVCGETEGEKLKGCKKASVASILSMISLFGLSLVLLRKKK